MFGRRYGRGSLRLTPAALAALRAHDWPGNVRELEHSIERAAVLSPGDAIEPEHLGLVPGPPPPGAVGVPATQPPDGVTLPLGLPLDEVERRYVEATIAACGGNQSEAARSLRVGRNTLRRKAPRAR